MEKITHNVKRVTIGDGQKKINMCSIVVCMHGYTKIFKLIVYLFCKN